MTRPLTTSSDWQAVLYGERQWAVVEGDCLDVLRKMPETSVDAVVCDPPAGISFMGKTWDHDHGGRDGWVEAFAGVFSECLRVLKPGGHAFVWSIPRTSHWTATALEDAGFEVRDVVTHHYGSGFPKSLDVSKAIDRRGGRPDLAAEIGRAIRDARERRGLTAYWCDREFCGGSTNWSWFEGRSSGQRAPTPETFASIAEVWPEVAHLAKMVAEAEREVVGRRLTGIGTGTGPTPIMGDSENRDITAPATDAARQWEGWGTALKPATEMWLLARRPLAGTVAANVLEFGTGALNVAGCRVDATGRPARQKKIGQPDVDGALYGAGLSPESRAIGQTDAGRWPPNLLLTHSQGCGDDCADGCPVRQMDEQSGEQVSGVAVQRNRDGAVHNQIFGSYRKPPSVDAGFGDSGGASRFFPRFRYTAKPSSGERNAGLSERSSHPTVKAISLMRWLCRLVTPPGGVIVDPFAGSGSTVVAALQESFRCIGIEREAEYVAIARRRIEEDMPLFSRPRREASA